MRFHAYVYIYCRSLFPQPSEAYFYVLIIVMSIQTQRKRVFEDATFLVSKCSSQTVIVSCVENRFAFFDPTSLKRSTYRVEESSRCVAIDCPREDANQFLSGNFDGTMCLWDLRNPRRPVSAI